MADTDQIAAIRAHVEKHKDRERAMFTVAGVSAILSELSRLSEAEKRYKEALEAATGLERAGVMLANAAFNIDQMGAENVGAQHIRSLKSSQVEWDTAAVVFARASRALQGSGE
jgi:hypothetical protein